MELLWILAGLAVAMQPLNQHLYNFLVAIEYRGAVVSGGSLLRMDVVLTSAVHMTMDQDQYLVYAGRYNLSLPTNRGWGRVLRIKSIHVHPQYRRTQSCNNFAVVKLHREVDTPVKVQLDVHNRAAQANRSFAMIGWGLVTGKRLETPVGVVGNLISFDACLDYNRRRRDRQTEFCLSNSSDILDSGSPAIAFNHQGIPVIVGIASWAFPFEVKEFPPSFGMVNYIVPWINHIIADANATSSIPPTIAKVSPLSRAT